MRRILHVLRLPDLDRAERIGEFWRHPDSRTFGELLIEPGGRQNGASGPLRASGQDRLNTWKRIMARQEN